MIIQANVKNVVEDRITNQKVQERMGKEKELLTTIKDRKLEYMGDIIRN